MYCDGGSVPTISAARPPRRCSSGRASAPQDTYRNPPHDAAVARVVVGRGQPPPADDGEDEGGRLRSGEEDDGEDEGEGEGGAGGEGEGEGGGEGGGGGVGGGEGDEEGEEEGEGEIADGRSNGGCIICDNIRAILGS